MLLFVVVALVQYVEPVFDRRTQGVPFHTGYQDRQLSTWMENIIGYADCRDLPNFSALGIRTHSLMLVDTLAPE